MSTTTVALKNSADVNTSAIKVKFAKSDENNNDDVASYSNISIIKDVDFVLDNHSHGKFLKRIVDLVKNEVFVKDGNDLCRLCGLPHETKGGDFQSYGLSGDLKFAIEGGRICLGGGVDKKTIRDQGEMLVIVYHPRKDKNTPVYAGTLNVWNAEKDAWGEAAELIKQWEEWHNNGRKNADKAKFDTKNFYIDIHDKDDDRFYVKSSFVREHIKYFVKNDAYVLKTGTEAKLARFFSVASLPVEGRSDGVRKVVFVEMSVAEMIAGIVSGLFYIPDFQRELLPNEKFLLYFVVSTIMAGEALNRGVFMFYDKGDGKLAVVDGQQRLYNAIKGFFIDGHRLGASGMNVMFEGKNLDVSNLTWDEMKEMAKSDKTVARFTEFVLKQKFTCKLYTGYSYREMATEYRIANSGAQMNRQELRASYDSRLGDIVRYITTPKLREGKDEIKKAAIKMFDDLFGTIPSKGTLKDINIPIARMNVDSLLSYTFHSCNTWKEGYRETEDMIDAEYEKYTEYGPAFKAWKKTQEYLEILSDIVKFYKEAGENDRYSCCGERGTRNHRTKGFVLADQEEWDIVMFLVLELMRRNNGKKLEITGDVLSYILKNHYKHTAAENEMDYESSYGMSTRKGQRTWDEINTIWFPKWEKLLSSSEKELSKIGFSFN